MQAIILLYNDANDKDIQDEDRITKYPHGSNVSFINYFNNKKNLILVRRHDKNIKGSLKKTNFDDVTEKKKKIKIGFKFLINHTEY